MKDRNELPDFVIVGAKFSLSYAPAVYHVRAIVDGCAVCRWWRKSKQRWEYEVMHPEWFEVNIESFIQK